MRLLRRKSSDLDRMGLRTIIARLKGSRVGASLPLRLWNVGLATALMLASGVSGCSDGRAVGLHQGLLQTQSFLSSDCPQHSQQKANKDHLCVLSVRELPTKSAADASSSQKLCDALFSEAGRKLFPKHNPQEFIFGQTSPSGWPSRIVLTLQSEIPWSVVVLPKSEAIELRTYGADLSTPIERVEIKSIPELKR